MCNCVGTICVSFFWCWYQEPDEGLKTVAAMVEGFEDKVVEQEQMVIRLMALLQVMFGGRILVDNHTAAFTTQCDVPE